MRSVNVTEAKAQLSRLLEEVQAGEEIVLAKAGRPVAKLVRYEPSREPRQLGLLKGQIWIAPDFDEPDEELIRQMEEGPVFPDEVENAET